MWWFKYDLRQKRIKITEKAFSATVLKKLQTGKTAVSSIVPENRGR